jgi:Flp pilus assembly protein TadG
MNLRRSGMCRALGRFGRHKRGAIAVEFVLVVPIFLFLVFAILETSILYVIATVMEGEVSLAARTIRTGQLQQEADPEAAFRSILCSNLNNVLNCDNVIIDVRTFDDFGEMAYDNFVDDQGNASGNLFTPGTADDIVLVRIAYAYTIVTPYLSQILPPAGQDTVMLFSGAAFKNEPFQNAF